MAENNISIKAPYAFVPFSPKICPPYRNQPIPGHDDTDPELLSGEISVTLTAETPIFISDGKNADKGNQNSHFYKGPNGSYMIPGSTLRGLLRANMQILGFGALTPGEDFEDIRLMYREIASAKGSVDGPLKEHYTNVMNVKTKTGPNGKPYSIPTAVQSGYIVNEIVDEKESYRIYPTISSYIPLPRNHPSIKRLGLSDAHACYEAVYYQGEGKHILKKSDCATPPDGYSEGTILCGGNMNKQNHVYLFPSMNMASDAITEDATEDDTISYNADWELRYNSLKGFHYNPEFWSLPKKGQKKAVFYIRYDKHLYWGMSPFLRIGYTHSLGEGLPEYKNLISNPQNDENIDYPHGIFGYAGEKRSFRSRVSVGDFPLVGNCEEMKAISLILGEPRPSWYAAYTKDGEHYNEEDFLLSGYKQYWMKEAETPPEPENNKVVTQIRPLPAGVKFTGKIRYHNLRRDELGLLLWCIRLEEGCYQQVGMAKPYGYGRVKVKINSLMEENPAELYRSFAYSPQKPKTHQTSNQVNSYIHAYWNTAADLLYYKGKKTVLDNDEIKDFLFLHSHIRKEADVRYLELEEYKNLTGKFPTISKLRETSEPSASVNNPNSSAVAENDPYIALRAKFNGGIASGKKFRK